MIIFFIYYLFFKTNCMNKQQITKNQINIVNHSQPQKLDLLLKKKKKKKKKKDPSI